MRKSFFQSVATVMIVTFGSGCWMISNAVDHAVYGAVDHEMEAQNKQNEKAAQAMVANYTPMLMQYYVTAMLSMAFQSGGYAVDDSSYKPGQYTRWAVVNRGEGDKHPIVERAYLSNDKEGNQWWKVKFTDLEENQTSTLEALFTPDRSKILRLRAKFPQDTEGKEMPVEENTYYVPPHKLTKYSLEGALKGTEKVSVPAGNFTARRYVFGDAAGGSHEWFAVSSVPGGSVKFVARNESSGSEDDKAIDGNNYEMVLTAFGDGAVSELGSK